MTDITLEEKIQAALDRFANMPPVTAVQPAAIEPLALAATQSKGKYRNERSDQNRRNHSDTALIGYRRKI